MISPHQTLQQPASLCPLRAASTVWLWCGHGINFYPLILLLMMVMSLFEVHVPFFGVVTRLNTML